MDDKSVIISLTRSPSVSPSTSAPSMQPITTIPTSKPSFTGIVAHIDVSLSGVTSSLTANETNQILETIANSYDIEIEEINYDDYYFATGVIALNLTNVDVNNATEIDLVLQNLEDSLENTLGIHDKDVSLVYNPEDGMFAILHFILT